MDPEPVFLHEPGARGLEVPEKAWDKPLRNVGHQQSDPLRTPGGTLALK